MGKIGQARGFLFFRIVNKFFFRKRKKNKNQEYKTSGNTFYKRFIVANCKRSTAAMAIVLMLFVLS